MGLFSVCFLKRVVYNQSHILLILTDLMLRDPKIAVENTCRTPETRTDPLLASGDPKLDFDPYVKWEENHIAVLHYLKSVRVTSFVEEKEDDPMGAIEHLTKVNIPESKIFNIDTKDIIEESEHAGFYQSSTIPFHLLAVISLLIGKCPKRHIFVGTEKRWKNVCAYCLQVCKNQETAEQVLKMVVMTHAKETQSTYKLLFVCSLQPTICSVRGPAIYHCVESMNSKIDDVWRLQAAEKELQALKLKLELQARVVYAETGTQTD